MKHFLYFLALSLFLLSCTTQKQASTLTGRTDDVYFTASDTRKKPEPPPALRSYTESTETASKSDAGNYTSSYANRLRNFGTSRRYYYDAYRPTIVPSVSYNMYTGWSMGMSYVNPCYGYMSGYNSPFSPYFGYNMPFYNPFYSYGWGNSWMYHYYPSYYYNPYYYNPYSYGYQYNYGYYNNYGYNNPHFNNYYNNPGNRNNTTFPNSHRRTGTSTNIPSSNTTVTQPQNNSRNNNSSSGNGSWYSNGSSDRSSGSGGGGVSRGSSGSSGSGDRSSGGATGGSSRRR